MHEHPVDSPLWARVPPEILRLIAIPLCDIDGHTQQRSTKQGLASCSLTCKSWAGILRERLFEMLILRNIYDVQQLNLSLDSPTITGRPMIQIIQFIGIDLDGGAQVPWLHHLYELSTRITRGKEGFSKDEQFTFEINFTGDKTSERHFLPFESLPRSIPYMHPPVTQLYLKKLRLRRVTDLVRLIHGFPKLHDCWLDNVCFVETERQLQRQWIPLRRISAQTAVNCIVSGCGDGLPSSQLSLAAVISSSTFRIAGFNFNTWSIVSDALLSYWPLHQSTVEFKYSAGTILEFCLN